MVSLPARIDGPVQDVDEQIDENENSPRDEREAHDAVVVGAQDRVDGVEAQARPVEHAFDHDGAGEQDAEDQADLRHRADERVAQHVLPDDHALRQAHGVLIEHEVGVDGIEHAGAGEAHDGRHGGKGQRHDGQDEVRDDVREDGPVALDEGVDEEEAGHGIGTPAVGAALQRRPAELHGEQQLEQDREPEAGDGEAGDREEAQGMVDDGIAPCRRDDAERNAEQDGDDDGDQGQLDGRRHAREQILGDRALRVEAGAEIAGDDGLEIAPELHGERLVEPELLLDGIDLGLCRAFAGQHDRGIGRNDVADGEHDQQQADQRGHKPRQPLQDES